MNKEALLALAEKWVKQANPENDHEFEPDNVNHLIDRGKRMTKEDCANELKALIKLLLV